MIADARISHKALKINNHLCFPETPPPKEKSIGKEFHMYIFIYLNCHIFHFLKIGSKELNFEANKITKTQLLQMKSKRIVLRDSVGKVRI